MKDQISFLKADVEKERQMRSASDAKVVRLQADNDMFLLKLKEENERRMQGFNDLFEKEEEMKKEREDIKREKENLAQKMKVLRSYLSKLSSGEALG
jgi:ABC-type enterochelin transport system substrate-binding protein